jgi:hypothetical protein
MRVNLIDGCTSGPHVYDYDQVVPLPAIDDTIGHQGLLHTYTVYSVRLRYLPDMIEATISATVQGNPPDFDHDTVYAKVDPPF